MARFLTRTVFPALTACAVVLLAAPAVHAQQPIEGLGAGQLKLTTTPPDTDAAMSAIDPALAYNPTRNEYLLAWTSDVPPANDREEIRVQILAADGTPKGPVRELTDVDPTGDVFGAQRPAVTYAPEADRYIVAYVAPCTPTTVPACPGASEFQREILARGVDPDGVPIGTPVRVSTTPFTDFTGFTDLPALTVGRNETGAAEQVRFAWQAVEGITASSETKIFTRRFSSTLDSAFAQGVASFHAAGLNVNGAPAIVFLPGATHCPVNCYALAWSGEVASGDYEVFVRLITPSNADIVAQRPVSHATGPDDLADLPQLAFRAAAGGPGELLAAFTRRVPKPGTTQLQRQVFAERIAADTLEPVGQEAQISAMADGVSFNRPSLSYAPAPDRYLVSWAGATLNQKFERVGQALDGAGSSVASDDFGISATPPLGENDADAGDGALAFNTTSGRWLHVWEGENLLTQTNGHNELYARLIGENFDRDYDGFNIPDDCDDANPNIKPGATDVFDNGVDEDCKDGDAQNPDRDGDGSNRPDDCNDSNPFVKPGATDVPGNGVDEDCRGGDAALPAPPPAAPQLTRATIDRSFATFPGRFTEIRKLTVVGAKPGMSVIVSCKGRGCPRKLRKRQTIKVTKAGKVNLVNKFFKGAKLRTNAQVEVRILEPGAIARVERYKFRRNAGPKRTQLCIAVGKTAPSAKACPKT